MFIEKLAKKDLFNFIRNIGLEPVESGVEVKQTKNNDQVVLVACKSQKFETENQSDVEAIVFTDFDCFDLVHPQNSFSKCWKELMYKKFGNPYDEALNALIWKRKSRLKDKE